MACICWSLLLWVKITTFMKFLCKFIIIRSPNEHWVARLGALRRGTSLPSPYEQLKTISRIIIHPGYLDFGFVNDISLLQMDSPVVFSDYVRPVCLPHSDQELKNEQLCTVIGWGQLFEVGRIFRELHFYNYNCCA